jgi:hypothetical protein
MNINNNLNKQTMKISNTELELLIEMIEDRIFMLKDINKIDNIDYEADIFDLEQIIKKFKIALKS